MIDLALITLTIAGLMGLFVGMKYMLADAFMPYQAAVAGKSWDEVAPGVQTIILGMLRIIGGGFASLGATTLWLCLAVHEGVR